MNEGTEREEQIKQEEQAKNESDAFLQDYLMNMKKGLESYQTSLSNYYDRFTMSMENQKESIMKDLGNQIENMNKRMAELKGVIRETVSRVENKSETASNKRPPQLKDALDQIRTLLDQIEEG